MKVLAIDPGFERIGIAVIEKTSLKKDALVYSNCFKTSAKISFPERLKNIGSEIEKIIKKYKPEVLAIEKLYFTTNQKTAMGVAEARGTIIYVASKYGLSVCEYTPPQIKIAVTGYGKATKEMIMSMVPKLIDMDAKINSDDEIDAIAVGLTCLACEKLIFKGF
ncbi:MAG TPA: crossover junction endodeoxyribonuclease RuvC [Candidatus Paceibacterota bacterium]|nr:crossover junction endodeoxyribonuclease RuvC [Candidatus Paceibacterota bacterium]